jgi:hypothetical protein
MPREIMRFLAAPAPRHWLKLCKFREHVLFTELQNDAITLYSKLGRIPLSRQKQ